MMSSWEAESMAVSNKENNALTLTRLGRDHRCPQHRPGSRPRHVAGGEPDQNRRIRRVGAGSSDPGELRRKADTAQPRAGALIRPPLLLPRKSQIHRY